ncbi:hypothetical protein T4D_419 [Trichinella pseudospiralis]|uniref:Uncharacterized protein n=1 Tax=Trichinella pseudospiralis TaxID=6337 RepID=A0A0V1FBM3_TRIPS|nr:hypothetical protein T4D_419 [Trichinella pseudospiralis]
MLFNSSSFANVKVKWIFELKTNDDWAASQSHMALKAGCCVLAFPFGRVSCFAYHEKNGRQRFGQIDAVNVLVGVVFNAFPNCGLCLLIKSESMSLPDLLCLRLSRIGMKALEMWLHKHHWLRKQSTGYEVSLHQTTVVVQVGILTLIKLEVVLPSEHYVYLEDGYCNHHGTRIRGKYKIRIGVKITKSDRRSQTKRKKEKTANTIQVAKHARKIMQIFIRLCKFFNSQRHSLGLALRLMVYENSKIFELKTNDDWAASQSHMALKAGCCVLAFPFGRVSCFAYHEKNGRQRFGQIDAVNVLVGVVFNAFPNCGLCHLIKSESMSLPGLLCLRLSRIGMKALEMWLHKHHWLRKQSTGYGVSLHQTTVVVQVGILTLIKLEVVLPSEHYVYLEDGYCNHHGTRIRGKYKIRIGVKDQITKSDRKSQTKRKKEKTTNTIQLAKHARKIMQIFIVYANT